MSIKGALLEVAKWLSRDTEEENAKWEKMKQEKARDAAENSHKDGWVPGGTAEKGHFEDRKKKKKKKKSKHEDTKS